MEANDLMLFGALRLSPADSIGIPLFFSGNSMYVPEMDGDFNIVRFLDFFNDGQYEIVKEMPREYEHRIFSVGQPAPIMFWFKNKVRLIEGDAEQGLLEEMFGIEARTSAVLGDLGGMLHDARTGVFVHQQEQWVARDLVSAFDDVFLEEPSRTKYWVSRYRVALEEARKITQPPHPIDVRLRTASTAWLSRFATKSDFAMLSAVLGEASQGIYSVDQIRGIVFAYTCHKIRSGPQSLWLKIGGDDTVTSLFPEGLYSYYVARGWPHVPFDYLKPDFVATMKELLAEGKEGRSWNAAVRAAELFFSSADAPNAVEDAAMIYLRVLVGEYRRLLGEYQTAKDRRSRPERVAEMRIIADFLFDAYERISQLSCVINGADRLSGEMMEGRYNISGEVLADYAGAKNQGRKVDR